MWTAKRCFFWNMTLTKSLIMTAWTKTVFHLSLWLRQIIGLLQTKKIMIFCSTSSNNCYCFNFPVCSCERLIISFSREFLSSDNVGILKFVPASYRLMQSNLVLQWIFQILDLKLGVSKAHVLCRTCHLEIIKLFVLFLELIPAEVSESDSKWPRLGKLEFRNQIHQSILIHHFGTLGFWTRITATCNWGLCWESFKCKWY